MGALQEAAVAELQRDRSGSGSYVSGTVRWSARETEVKGCDQSRRSMAHQRDGDAVGQAADGGLDRVEVGTLAVVVVGRVQVG